MHAFAHSPAPPPAFEAGLREELGAALRHVAAQAAHLGLESAAQWELHSRLGTARAQLASATPSVLLLRIALLSLRSLLHRATEEDAALALAGRLDNGLRRLPA